MRRPVLSLGLAALSLSCMLPVFASDALAADSTAAPAAVTGPAPDAAPSASTQTAATPATAAAATASTAPATSTASAPAIASAAAPAQAAAPAAASATAPAPAEAPAATQTVHTLPAPTSQPSGMNVPVRGMNMANVEHIFGTPVQKYDAVGKPPITRWDYQDYVVYFEYNMVLHTVMKNQPNG